MDVCGGELYAIPLFVSNDPTLTKYRKESFKGRGKEFVFCRVIKNMGGGGILVEVFNRVDDEQASVASIVTAPRLFRPVPVSESGLREKRSRSATWML